MSANRVVLIGLTFWALRAASGGLVIDSFDDANEGNWPIGLSSLMRVEVVDADVDGVLGRWRETALGTSSLDLPGIDQLQVNVPSGEGILDYASSAGAESVVSLFYGGDPIVEDLHADLSRNELIRIEFTDFDLAGNVGMRVGVFLNATRGASPVLVRSLTSAGPQFLDFPFTEFSGGQGFDLADIENIVVGFLPPPGTDFRVSQIVAAVPEPTTLCLLAVGGLLATWRRGRASDARESG